jgi:hypothetical protein
MPRIYIGENCTFKSALRNKGTKVSQRFFANHLWNFPEGVISMRKEDGIPETF